MAEALWTDVATAYDRSFATLCTGTTDALLAHVPPGARVLDVGCGSGHVTESLVAAGHVVHAVDPDPEMVALATSRSAADVRRGGLPDLPYDAGSFEVVVANFVLNHVDDPRAAARGLAPVVRPGGHVVATIWPAYVPPQATLWNALLDGADAVRPEVPRLAPELDFERSPDGLGAVLAEAGLDVVEVGTTEWDWRVRAADFWAGATRVGNFGVTWRAQSAQVQERMRGAFRDASAPWRDGDELVFGVRAAIAHATAPS
jgi:2-polyprenyl-3-methyl-5-hydroxy-6-metoxy-1,4-benzoquinol methylase